MSELSGKLLVGTADSRLLSGVLPEEQRTAVVVRAPAAGIAPDRLRLRWRIPRTP